MLIWPLRMIGMWIGQYQRAVASGERIFQLLDEDADIVDPAAPARAAERRRRAALRGRHVRLRRRPARAARARPRRRARQHGRGDRPHGLGQDHARLARPALLRPAGRPRHCSTASTCATCASPTCAARSRRSPRTRSCSRRRVAGNIAYGAPGATREDVVEAARKAQAHEFIEALPEGYDTVVGERGLTLSGGQRQRLSIARALLVDPRVLILDDATASVDATTEARIRLALETVMEGRTTIIIAHRLSTIALADEIVVLEDGARRRARTPRRARRRRTPSTPRSGATAWSSARSSRSTRTRPRRRVS